MATAGATATIAVMAGFGWFGLKHYRSHTDCERRNEVLARQIESVRHDASEQLKIGVNKADVSRFFTEHGIPFTISASEARGTEGLIGVHVALDPAGTLTQEPIVVELYTNCL
jgi:hypothetical protein